MHFYADEGIIIPSNSKKYIGRSNIMKRLLTLTLAAAMLVVSLVSCSSASSEVKVIDIPLTEEEYAFGVDKDQPELLEQTNAFIAKIK